MFTQTLQKCIVLVRRARPAFVECVAAICRPKAQFYCLYECSIQKRNLSQNNGPGEPIIPFSADKTAEQQLQEFREANAENEKYYRIIELEVDVLRHDGEKVPDILRPSDWIMILEAKSKMKRKRLLEHLWKVQLKKRTEKETRKLMQDKYHLEKQQLPPEDTGALQYGLQGNHMFIRIGPHAITSWQNQRLITSMLYEPKIVFDCSYTCMNNQESKSCAKQIMYAFSDNRQHQRQFNLYLCNAHKSSMLMKNLTQLIPTLYDDLFPLNVTSESYLDLFKKEDLVYLTPHCYTPMQEYNPNAVYIIGALVDKSQPGPLSLAKAKKENIRMEKLPLDRHLQWGPGSGKNLTLNQVLSILLDVRATNDWPYALRHVPTRKLKPAREYQLRKKMEHAGRMYSEPLNHSPVTASNNRFADEVHEQENDLEHDKKDFNFHNRKSMYKLYKK